MNKHNSFFPVFLITIFVDQASKFLATILGFQITYNTGISFSTFAASDPKFLTFVLGVAMYLLFNYFKSFWKENGLAAGLFFGGAVANIFDRLLFDAVRDWIAIPFTYIHNNLADWAIFAGLFLLLFPFVSQKTAKKQ